MSDFDLSWFLTVPGMFISAGVLLLLVAIVVLIVSSAKGKKEKKNIETVSPSGQGVSEVASAIPSSQFADGTSIPPMSTPTQMSAGQVQTQEIPVMQDPMVEVAPVVANAPIPTVPPMVGTAPVMQATPIVGTVPAVQEVPIVPPTPVVQATPIIEPTPVVQAVPIVEPAPVVQAAPIVEPAPFVQAAPIVEPVPVAQAAPIVEPVPVAQATPVVELAPVVQEAPIVEPVPVAPVTPAVEYASFNETDSTSFASQSSLGSSLGVVTDSSVVEQMPVGSIEVTPVSSEVHAPQPVIYGGASPIVSDLDLGQNSQHQIYGGANPLENTQSMPIMSTPMTNQVENGVPYGAMSVVPNSEQVVATPVMEPIINPVQQ